MLKSLKFKSERLFPRSDRQTARRTLTPAAGDDSESYMNMIFLWRHSNHFQMELLAGIGVPLTANTARLGNAAHPISIQDPNNQLNKHFKSSLRSQKLKCQRDFDMRDMELLEPGMLM